MSSSSVASTIGVGRIRSYRADRRFKERDRMPRKVRKDMGSRSPVADWNIGSEEKEDSTSEESEMRDNGTERDSVGCEGNESDAARSVTRDAADTEQYTASQSSKVRPNGRSTDEKIRQSEPHMHIRRVGLGILQYGRKGKVSRC
jgi:hypothetical protein